MSQEGSSRTVAVLHLLLTVLLVIATTVLVVRVLVATAPAPDTARASLTELKYSSFTNANAAHVTVTNMSPVMRWACVEGVVTSKKTQAAASSVAVCTGDMKPHTTVTLDAIYKIGAVEALCSRPVGSGDYERKELDWDLCSFEIIDAPP